MRRMSSSSRRKSSAPMFSFRRAGCTDFGMTISPLSRCQRMTTCAGVPACFAEMLTMTGSASRAPRPGGLPRLGLDAALLMKRAQGLLLKAGMKLDLIDGRGHSGLADDPLQVIAIEVRHSDRADPPFPLQTHERLPAFDVAIDARPRPMDQVEGQSGTGETTSPRLRRMRGRFRRTRDRSCRASS